MVLVDTSVLVNFFKGINNEKEIIFENILEKGILFGINNLIYTELLQGAKNNEEFDLLDLYLSSQRFYDLRNGKGSYRKAASIFRKCRGKGVTVRSTIDLLIAQTAIDNDLYLLHDDKDFTNIANIENKLKIYT